MRARSLGVAAWLGAGEEGERADRERRQRLRRFALLVVRGRERACE
jgi:hypothetical protein